MSDLTTILAQVLADHRVTDRHALVGDVPTWTRRCTCGGYERSDRYTNTADAQGAELSDDARQHVAQMLAAALHFRTRPLLNERYGPDNYGADAHEKNLFAAGALWWYERLFGDASPDYQAVTP